MENELYLWFMVDLGDLLCDLPVSDGDFPYVKYH